MLRDWYLICAGHRYRLYLYHNLKYIKMKKTIRKHVGYYFNWEYGVSIEKIKEDIAEMEKLGANEILIEPCDDYGDMSIYTEAVNRREETDEEYEERLKLIAVATKRAEDAEKKKYEELKKKYGNERT